MQTKQEKASERLKKFRSELEEYRDSFKRIKSANEDVVCSDAQPQRSFLPRTVHTNTHSPTASNRSAHRTARPPPARRRHTRKPVRTARPGRRCHILALRACLPRPQRPLPAQRILGRRAAGRIRP